MNRFLIVDDHPLFREALQTVVRQVYVDADIYEATSIEGALDVLAAHEGFDLALLDLALPDVNGFEGLIRIRAAFPRLPIVVVSGFEEPELVSVAISLGVAGYLPKSASRGELAQALREVLGGGVHFREVQAKPETCNVTPAQEVLSRLRNLTPQQLAVMQLIREGLQNKQIAHRLGLAETTVKAHVSEILRKLNVFTRTTAVIEVSKVDFDALRGQASGQAPAERSR